MSAVKLYLPYGFHHRVADSRLVIFHWFCVARETPFEPIAAMIMGYKTLTEDARARAEATVNEFFSEEEFHLLRSYLRERHGEDLRTTLLVAPVSAVKPDSSTQIGQGRPFAQCVPSEACGFYRLSEEKGYTLPFTVWGYYSLPARMRAAQPNPATLIVAPGGALAAASDDFPTDDDTASDLD